MPKHTLILFRSRLDDMSLGQRSTEIRGLDGKSIADYTPKLQAIDNNFHQNQPIAAERLLELEKDLLLLCGALLQTALEQKQDIGTGRAIANASATIKSLYKFLAHNGNDKKSPLEMHLDDLVIFLEQEAKKVFSNAQEPAEQLLQPIGAGRSIDKIQSLLDTIESQLTATTQAQAKETTRLASIKEILTAAKALREAAKQTGNDQGKTTAANQYQEALCNAIEKDEQRITQSGTLYQNFHQLKTKFQSAEPFGAALNEYRLPSGFLNCTSVVNIQDTRKAAAASSSANALSATKK